MALQSGQYLRGGANGGVTDADGRRFAVGTGGVADSVSNSASAAAPGATGAVVTLGALNPGVYNLRGTITLTGTAETQLANAIIRKNSVSFSTLPTLTGIVVPFQFDRITLTAGSFDIRASAAATAGSIYTAHLVATRVE